MGDPPSYANVAASASSAPGASIGARVGVMTRSATNSLIVTPVRRPNTVVVNIPPEFSRRHGKTVKKRVVDALSLLVPTSAIKCIQPMGSDVRITFSSPVHKDALVCNGFAVDGLSFPLRVAERGAVFVQLHRLPYEVSDEDLALFLGYYGKVLDIKRVRDDLLRGCENGSRTIKMALNQPIPRVLRLRGFWFTVFYRGQPEYCTLCRTAGHTPRKCPMAGKCRACGAQGHFERNCPGRYAHPGNVPPPGGEQPPDSEGSSAPDVTPARKRTRGQGPETHSVGGSPPLPSRHISPVHIDDIPFGSPSGVSQGMLSPGNHIDDEDLASEAESESSTTSSRSCVNVLSDLAYSSSSSSAEDGSAPPPGVVRDPFEVASHKEPVHDPASVRQGQVSEQSTTNSPAQDPALVAGPAAGPSTTRPARDLALGAGPVAGSFTTRPARDLAHAARPVAGPSTTRPARDLALGAGPVAGSFTTRPARDLAHAARPVAGFSTTRPAQDLARSGGPVAGSSIARCTERLVENLALAAGSHLAPRPFVSETVSVSSTLAAVRPDQDLALGSGPVRSTSPSTPMDSQSSQSAEREKAQEVLPSDGSTGACQFFSPPRVFVVDEGFSTFSLGDSTLGEVQTPSCSVPMCSPIDPSVSDSALAAISSGGASVSGVGAVSGGPVEIGGIEFPHRPWGDSVSQESQSKCSETIGVGAGMKRASVGPTTPTNATSKKEKRSRRNKQKQREILVSPPLTPPTLGGGPGYRDRSP